MALHGTLKDFALPDILQLIGIQRKTGVLTLDSDSETVTVRFHEGHIVGADSSTRNLEDLLGSVLVRAGRITETQLSDALKTQRSTLQRLGYVLVKSGAISEDALREALRIQVTQMVYRLFRWREGRYHFVASEQVEPQLEQLEPISAETILLEGARMVDEWPIIERRIRSARAVFRKTSAGTTIERPVASLVEAHVDFEFATGVAAGIDDSAEGILLSPEEREVLRMVDGRSTVQELTDRSHLGEFDVYRSLHELLNRQLIEDVPTPAAVQARGTRVATRIMGRLVGCALLALALFSLATVGANPATPWKWASDAGRTDLLKSHASRGRMESIDGAIQVFFFDLGVLPDQLDTVTRAGYLRADDLLDPWGRPYQYEIGSVSYQIFGFDSAGDRSPDLVLQHRLTAAERMVLRGAARPES